MCIALCQNLFCLPGSDCPFTNAGIIIMNGDFLMTMLFAPLHNFPNSHEFSSHLTSFHDSSGWGVSFAIDQLTVSTQFASAEPRGSGAKSHSKPPLSGVGMLRLQPKAGSDLTKILFANFRWVRPGE